MAEVKSEYHLDPTTGRRYVMNKLGGTTDSKGNDVGLVSQTDGITAQHGDLGTYTMSAATLALTGAEGITQILIGVAFRGIEFSTLATIPSGSAVVIAVSTTDNDNTAVASLVNAAVTAIGTPDGIDNPNVLVLTNSNQNKKLIESVTSIKTIAIRAITTAQTVLVEKVS